jgi:hypothetical protein
MRWYQPASINLAAVPDRAGNCGPQKRRADFVAVEPHSDDGVGAAGAGFAPHALAGLVAVVGQQPGVPGGFPAGDGLG